MRSRKQTAKGNDAEFHLFDLDGTRGMANKAIDETWAESIPFQSVQNGYSILLYPRYSITKSLYPEMGIDFFGQKNEI